MEIVARGSCGRLLVALMLAAVVAMPAHAAAPTRAALETRLAAAFAASDIPRAKAVAESILALPGRRPAVTTAGALDTLALRFFARGTPDAWEVAAGFLRRALALREWALGLNHADVAQTLRTLAPIVDYQGRWPEAVELEQRAIAIRLATPGTIGAGTAASYKHLGRLFYQLGRYAEGEAAAARALDLFDSLGVGHESQVVDALNNLGELARVQDHYDAAAQRFSTALVIARAHVAPDDPSFIALLNNLAGLDKDLSRFDEAEPLLLELTGLIEKSAQPDQGTLAIASLNLAEIYRLQGRLEEAAPLYARALAMARVLLPAGSPDLVPFISQAAVAHDAVGHHAAAESLYRESLPITEKTLGANHPLLAQSLHDLAGSLAAVHRYAEAESTYTRALAIRERALGPRHPETAMTRLALAGCLSDDPRADDPRAGDRAAATLLAEAIPVLDSATAYPEARVDAYALRASITARAGRMDAAIADLEVATASVDALRSWRGGGDATRAAFIAGKLGLFDRLVTWKRERGDLAGALETHEKARARVLLDQLAAGDVNLRSGIPPETLAPLEAAEQAARERLARAQERMADVRVRADLTDAARLEALAALEAARDSAAWDLQRSREAIKDRSPIWHDVLTRGGRTASLAEIQRDLSGGERMLVYHVGETSSELFVVPPVPGRATVVPLVVDAAAARELRISAGALTAAKLESTLVGRAEAPAFGPTASIAALLAVRGDDERALPTDAAPGQAPLLERRLRALATVLVPEPVWRLVRGAPRVAVVPDGALHVLPFEALVIGPRKNGAPRYWLDDGPAIRYGGSATSLLALDRRGAAAPGTTTAERVLSVSDPVFDSATADSAHAVARSRRAWAPLPGTALETAAIRAAFAPESIAVLARAAASERRVREALAGKRLLHFATHGFVTRDRSDVLAGLVLAAGARRTGTDDDGLLQLFEIYELKLDADLAVLSACETQRGPRVAGEGVFALSRGFLAAGCRRVVASLWAVSDASTAALVGGFFTGIATPLKGGHTPDYTVALRDAKRRLRSERQWADPFYWAPFVLAGVR